MRILITGAKGQLGTALQQALTGHQLDLTDLPEVDITDRSALLLAFQAFQPEVVVHCAAYTDVDGCVQNPDLAYRVNGLGAQNVALACAEVDAAMVHLSTNEVFAGTRYDGYEEWMPLDPCNVYGRTKALAEFHVRNLLPQHYIVRTAWLYAPGGHNFIHSILRNSRQVDHLRVVTDEIGNPTCAHDLATAIARLVISKQYGTYHLVNEGACSRYEFASEILRLAGLSQVELKPILLGDYQRASNPPPFAALQNITARALGIVLRPWREALAEYVAQHVR